MIHNGTRASILALLLVGLAATAQAQLVLEGTEEIDFDRPEAWAMKRSASLTLFTAVGPPRDRELGAFEIAVELGWNPQLSEEERRVGFNGTKVEDMGRLDLVPRARITVGLGRKTSLDLSYTPPIELEGLEPSLFAAALERPLWGAGPWVIGARAYGQIGEVEGDITCSEDDASIPPGEPGNEFGCEEASSDEVSLDYLGVGLTGGYWLSRERGSILHFGVFANHMDLEFQVNALSYGIRDRTTLVTDGWTYSITGGFSIALGRPTRLAVEAFYSPLEVDRPQFDDDGVEIGVDSRNDALFNLRAMFSYMQRIATVLLAIAVPGVPAHAEQLQLVLDPSATTVSFVLGATMHKVNGSFRLISGEVTYDPATGNASGEIVVDARSGDSGNNKRDRDMHRKVLESESHPTIVLRPERVEGELPTEGDADLRVVGSLHLHGRAHPVDIPLTVSVSQESLRLRATFEVPYVEWGLRDPSKFVLRVAKHVIVSVDAVGSLTSVSGADAVGSLEATLAVEDP
jgi:polyisoprenoid-binding protein YceI